MKDGLFRSIVIIWMLAVTFLIYNMWIDLKYISDLVYAYMKMVLEYNQYKG